MPHPTPRVGPPPTLDSKPSAPVAKIFGHWKTWTVPSFLITVCSCLQPTCSFLMTNMGWLSSQVPSLPGIRWGMTSSHCLSSWTFWTLNIPVSKRCCQWPPQIPILVTSCCQHISLSAWELSFILQIHRTVWKFWVNMPRRSHQPMIVG